MILSIVPHAAPAQQGFAVNHTRAAQAHIQTTILHEPHTILHEDVARPTRLTGVVDVLADRLVRPLQPDPASRSPRPWPFRWPLPAYEFLTALPTVQPPRAAARALIDVWA